MENSIIKIGHEITISEDFEIESVFQTKTIKVKKGDKAFIDSHGLAHYTSGEAQGMIQGLGGKVKIEGYDHENISKIIVKKLMNTFYLQDFLEGYDITEQDFTEKIEDVLSDIL